MGRVLWKRDKGEGKKRGKDRGAGGEVYTLLTTTSSHVSSFLGTYYSEAL